MHLAIADWRISRGILVDENQRAQVCMALREKSKSDAASFGDELAGNSTLQDLLGAASTRLQNLDPVHDLATLFLQAACAHSLHDGR